MEFRRATEADRRAVAEKSASRGCFGREPDIIDQVYALEHEGKVLAVGGLKIMNPTSAFCWMDLATEAKQHHMVFLYRLLRDFIDGVMEEHKIRRLMAVVEADFEEGIRLAEHLGFLQEFLMDDWIDGKAAWMYVRYGKG